MHDTDKLAFDLDFQLPDFLVSQTKIICSRKMS